ncbi:MAG: Crp/Fnr family transcriptional regulator, partial [Bacteroidetes bacterium]|nr:Crp/Fnr family transcriptional regulator [Bacteroidota bacterium]
MESLIAYLAAIRPMSLELINQLRERVGARSVKKREVIIRANAVSDHIFFVESGLFYGYRSGPEGDRVLGFMRETNLLCAAPGFCSASPSPDTIRALEPSELLYLSRTEVLRLANDFNEFQYIFRFISDDLHARTRQHLDILQMPRHEDRLLFFMKHNPGLRYRLPHKLLASYLGCTGGNLSLLKSKLKHCYSS